VYSACTTQTQPCRPRCTTRKLQQLLPASVDNQCQDAHRDGTTFVPQTISGPTPVAARPHSRLTNRAKCSTRIQYQCAPTPGRRSTRWAGLYDVSTRRFPPLRSPHHRQH
jgi:hypothetical protein